MFWTWERIPRETSFGRRGVHAFEPGRAGQYRGVSVLAPIIKRLRMLGRYDEAELQAAVLNAVMAAFVESPFDHDQFASALGGGEELSAYQQQRLDYYQAAPINVGGAKIAFTFPGEKVTLTKPSHPNSVFEAFERASLRNIASAMGMTYEQLSMDWGQVNYSSARAALLEVWRGFTARKEHFAQAFMAPIYAAWLEEAIDRGIVTLPKAGFCRGQGRLLLGQVDRARPRLGRSAQGGDRCDRTTGRRSTRRSSANAPSRARITSRRSSSGRASARR